MKIFGFLTGKSKMFVFGVIVAVLLTLAVGIVSGADYFSEGDCPLCEECGMEFDDADSTGGNFLSCHYRNVSERDILGSGGFCVRFYTDEKLASDQFAKEVKTAVETAQYWIDKEDEEDDGWRSGKKITILGKDDETFQYEEIHYSGYRGEEVIDYTYKGQYLYHKKYLIGIQTDDHKDKNDAKKAFDALVKCAKAVVDEKDIDSKVSFTLEHYPPFPYLAEKDRPIGAPIGGDLVATLKDKDGNGIPLKRVFFYVEPGTNLYGALKFPFTPATGWLRIYHNLNVPMDAYIADCYTINNGLSSINYILSNCIGPHILSKSLIKDGKVEGTIKAVVVNESTLEIEYEASIPIEFKAIAQIVKISGEGRSFKFKEAYTKEYPDSPTWGPGRVRVKRLLANPNFDYKPIEEGFLLMPGDIIDIDGNTKIEIVWINGNMATVVVPDKIQLKDTEYRPPHARMVLLPTAHTSGFLYPSERIIADLFGFGTTKGTDFLIQSVPVVGGGIKFGVDVYNSIKKELDWSKQAISTKVRIRSTVRIDATGDNVKVYNIEGSPDIKTVKGEEVTLADKEMVVISENGSLSKVQSFDPEKVLNEFYDTIPCSTDVTGLTFESHSKPCGSSVQIPLTLNGIEDKIGNMDITLSYDPLVLEATEVTKGDLTADSLFEYNIMAGTILISLADAEGFSGNGSIAYVTFNVIGAADSTSPLQIAALAANRAEDYEALTIPTNDGVFKVESGLTISVSDTTGAKGSTVEVPINLEGASEVGSMDIVLNYDANVLSAVDVEAGALGKNALIESNTARDGEVIIALADSSGINGDGTVASVTFEVIGDAGTTSYLTLEEVLVHNLDLGEIIPNTVNGTFEVT